MGRAENLTGAEVAKLMAEQARSARAVGGAVGGRVAKEDGTPMSGLRVVGAERASSGPPVHPLLEPLESRYRSLWQLLVEVYARIESGLDPSFLSQHERPAEGLVGVIDTSSDEYLCVEAKVMIQTLPEVGDRLGVSVGRLRGLVRTVEGRGWLFRGEDPNEEPVADPGEAGDPENLWEGAPTEEEEVMDLGLFRPDSRGGS